MIQVTENLAIEVLADQCGMCLCEHHDQKQVFIPIRDVDRLCHALRIVAATIVELRVCDLNEDDVT